ncbi:MAG: MlaD family protein, partial [Pseudomonadota bacterium]
FRVEIFTCHRPDTENYRAIVQISIQDGVQLPTDSSAAIKSTSLLGGNFLDLEPGADDVMLQDGDAIQFTQSAVNLEDLLGRFIFGQTDSGSGTGGGSGVGGGN